MLVANIKIEKPLKYQRRLGLVAGKLNSPAVNPPGNLNFLSIVNGSGRGWCIF